MMKFTAEQIAQVLGGEIRGDKTAAVNDVSKIEESREGTLCFLGEQRYVSYLPTVKASIVLISRSINFEGETPATLIVVDNARAAVAQLLQMVSEVLNPRKSGIEQPSFISEGVDVPQDAYIGAFAYIGKNVRLGKGVQIYPNCYVGDNVRIGDNTILYAGVKVMYNCVVGKDCILNPGVVIGGEGFGFEPDAEGINRKVPQIGNVIVEDDVEIGANTTVDRAMMGSTIVKYNAKIDNLVQVAHNVQVGESTFLCAQVGIAGSTKIGNHCILAGQVGVAGHIDVCDRAVFGAQAGISSTVREPGQYQGSPAINARGFWRSSVVFKNLPQLQKDLDNIKKDLQK